MIHELQRTAREPPEACSPGHAHRRARWRRDGVAGPESFALSQKLAVVGVHQKVANRCGMKPLSSRRVGFDTSPAPARSSRGSGLKFLACWNIQRTRRRHQHQRPDVAATVIARGRSKVFVVFKQNAEGVAEGIQTALRLLSPSLGLRKKQIMIGPDHAANHEEHAQGRAGDRFERAAEKPPAEQGPRHGVSEDVERKDRQLFYFSARARGRHRKRRRPEATQ